MIDSERHTIYDELAVGYALHALEPEDEVRFTQHLASCAACERAVAEHRETLVHLAHAAPPADPPAAVLEGIRAAVGADARASRPGGVVLDLDRARARRQVEVRRSWLVVGVAAAAALVLGLGGWNAALLRERGDQTAARETLAKTVEALEREGTVTVPLRSDSGEVLAVALVQDETMSLVVDGLEVNSDDTIYVLWGKGRAGGVRAVATFDVESDDVHVVRDLPVDEALADVDTLMVTHEPGRTPPPMTQQPILVSGSV